MRMISFMDTNHAFLLLLVSTIFSSFHTKLSTAQRNNTTSSSNACRCGAFGICSLQDSTICTCLPGFNPSPEWTSRNWSTGCLRRTPLKCERNNNGSREDGFLKVKVVNASTGSPILAFTSRRFGLQNECEGICLRFCECIAYGYDFSILNCLFWSDSLVGMQKSVNGSGSDLYIRVAGSELDRYKGGFKRILIIPIVAGFVSACVFTYVLSKWMSKRRGRKRSRIALGKAVASGSVDSSLRDTLDEANLEELPLFKFDILANATDNFSDDNKLGVGGFGPVYKGELGNGRKVAVKRLSKASGQGRQEFMNEVVLISKLQHRNLVRLLGCCVESEETMLVYEYMPNKSLDFFLFDSSQEFLDWGKRFNIIKGICRGLLYLHRDSRLKIIHRDLKPSNILLDNDWNPKISDFGMARIYGTEADHISTIRVVGTYGYMAPEYAMEGRFSEKSDVFSFGVLMLEICAGRKNKSFNNSEGAVNLLAHVLKLWNEDNVVASIDPRISSPGNQAEILRCIHIGLLCVQELPRDRPSVSSLLSMLHSEIVELPKLKPPAFALKSRISHTPTTYFQQSDQSSCSVNTITLSLVDGR